ncbi:phage portal protein [Sphingomicrobium sp. XHP0239]|uniref:phage portal protein n=1 Tax=Sphingomicrobium maritimum TaxID=3133972 RepID=UPI0031CCB29C
MKILGVEITRASVAKALNPVVGGWRRVLESFSGAWQQNVEIDQKTVLTNPVLFRCMTLIATDIAKMRVKLVEKKGRVSIETTSPSFSPVLAKPNDYQNRIQFLESWMLSKLGYGNAYALKVRDQRGVVVKLFILDPNRVRPLVATNGDVYYELRRDDLSKQNAEMVTVPAREIIHDRINTIFHPLIGTSPIYAAGLAAVQGVEMHNHSAKFFKNGALPSGFVKVPGEIKQEHADELRDHWNNSYSGDNAGKVALLSDGMEFVAVTASAKNSELVEQLKMTGEAICTAFGMPAHKVGVGAPPAYTNIEAINRQYYTDCLQIHVEQIEEVLRDGLALPAPYEAQFDTELLLRMDMATQATVAKDLAGAGIAKINEMREWFGWEGIEGGDTSYLQQQNYSLEALNKRDTQDDPFAKSAPPALPAPDNDDDETEDEAAKALAAMKKGLA